MVFLSIKKAIGIKKPLDNRGFFMKYGGEREIRTLVRDKPKHAFQACALSHSASSPILPALW